MKKFFVAYEGGCVWIICISNGFHNVFTELLLLQNIWGFCECTAIKIEWIICLGNEVKRKYRNEVWQLLIFIDDDNSHLITMIFEGRIFFILWLIKRMPSILIAAIGYIRRKVFGSQDKVTFSPLNINWAKHKSR